MTTKINHIILPNRASNANLRRIEGYSKQFSDLGFRGFYSAKSGLVTNLGGGSFNGLVSTLTNRIVGSSATFSQATGGNQPSVVTASGPNGRDALIFTTSDDYMTDSENLPTGDHCKIIVFKSDATSGNEYMLTTGTSGNRSMFHLGVGSTVVARNGPSTNESLVSLSFTPDQWNIAIETFDASAGKTGLSINGGSFSFDSDALAVVDAAPLTLGSASGGDLSNVYVSDVLLGNFDISATAYQEHLDRVLEYARGPLGLDV